MSLTGRFHRLKKDDEIEQDVRAELTAEQGSSDHRLVRVVVDRGVVYLSGSADSCARKWAIERAVGRVVGVRDVRDHLEVCPSRDDHREDGQIQTAARCALEWDARVRESVRADVTDGVLRLRGTVERFSQRDAAEEAVRNLIGVRDVVNEIKVAPVPSTGLAGDVEVEDVEAAIRRRFGVDTGCIAIGVDDGVVTLSGAVPAFALLDDIERAVRSIPGVTRINNELLVA
jgi:osmotically-inducible protein OsmY